MFSKIKIMETKCLILILFISLLFLFCSKKDQKTIISNKINYIESFGYNPFDNTQIYQLREGKTPSYKVSRFDTTHYYAIITLKPQLKINKNFLKDSISINFVESFAKINCQYLVSKRDFMRLDFYVNDTKIILFKGAPLDTLLLPFNIESAVKVNQRWSYLEFHRSPK